MIKKNAKIIILCRKFLQPILIINIAILILILCHDEPYNIIAFLPLSYAIIDFVFDNHIKTIQSNNYNGGFIYKVSLIVIFIRYVVTPLSIAITGNFYYYNIYTSNKSIYLSVALMIFELFCVYLTLYVARCYYSKKNNNDTNNNIETIKNKFVLILFSIIALIIILIVEPNLIIPRDFILLSESYQKMQINVQHDGFFTTLADLVKPVIFIVLLSFIKDKYDIKSSKIYITLSFVIMIFFVGMYTGTSRWEILFSGIIGLYLLMGIYRNFPKRLILVTGFVISISILSISLYKFSWMVKDSVNPVKDIIFKMFDMFQEYFSGPRAVANSIEMKNVYGKYINFSTFFNDFIGSIPIVAGLVDQTNRINVYFNWYHNVHNNSLIIPMVGIGYSYFPIFPPIFTVIFQWIIIKVDYKCETSKSIEYKYLYLYFGLYLSMCQGFNTQILFSKLIMSFLPLLILFKVNEKVYLFKYSKKKKHINVVQACSDDKV